MEKTVTLGMKAKDEVTSFSGTITSICQRLNGPTRIGITSNSLDKDGLPMEEQWFNIGNVFQF